MFNSLCNPFIYGWRVKEFRDVIASILQIFKCYLMNETQQSEIEMIEMVEHNAGEKLSNGSLAASHKSRWNTPIDTDDGASEQHKCWCKTAIPFNGIRNNMDSADDLELNSLSSKANSSKREHDTMINTATVHMQSRPNLRQPEGVNDGGCWLFVCSAMTKKIPCKATTTEIESGRYREICRSCRRT